MGKNKHKRSRTHVKPKECGCGCSPKAPVSTCISNEAETWKTMGFTEKQVLDIKVRYDNISAEDYKYLSSEEVGRLPTARNVAEMEKMKKKKK